MSDELDMDYEDRRSGMLIGRQAALADWSFRKEQRAFERQIKSLRAVKWNREHPESKRAHNQKWWARRPPEKKASDLAAKKRRRRAATAATAKVYRCRECGAEWCPAPWARGLAGRGEFCGNACRQRWRYQEKTPGARRIRRHG